MGLGPGPEGLGPGRASKPRPTKSAYRHLASHAAPSPAPPTLAAPPSPGSFVFEPGESLESADEVIKFAPVVTREAWDQGAP